MSDLIECYECGTKVHQLSSRSRCVECEHRRAIVNEDYNEKLHNRIAELERERDEWKGRAEIATYQILFGTDTDKATMNSMREQLTKRDLEQQIQALDDIRCQWLAKASEMPLGLECRSKGASCYNWAMYYAQELAHEIEQLRKGAGDE